MNKIIQWSSLFIFGLILLSCTHQGVYKSAGIIKEIEVKKYNLKYQDDYTEWKLMTDSLYAIYFKNRTKKINNFIKKKKFKNFVIKETFYIIHINGSLAYSVDIYTQDTLYSFNYQFRKGDLHKSDYGKLNDTVKVLATGTIYYIQKKDSIFIYKDAAIKDYDLNKSPSYYSDYQNGKLKQLTYNDSIIYRKKGSKMVIDLKKIKGYSTNWDTLEQTYYE